ncbi:MAG: LruC domain-containing protein [Prevotella sp.]|nr:LruC domain-containing protein [Prevotella sp.]
MRRNVNLFLTALVVVLGLVSCGEKDVYDPERHKEIIRYLSPVDSVDQKHTWQLTENHTYMVSIDARVGAKRLEIYSENPITSSEAEMMSRVFVSDGQTVTLTVSMPSLATTLYAAIVDGDGKYTVTSFNKSDRNVSFNDPIATQQSPLVASPTVMAYTYCYEEDFPEPGDYDYNDVVLRIALERTGQKTIDIHTTLSAVGASRSLAGALRLVGYRYQDIDSIVAKDGKTFNVNVPSTCHELLQSDDILQQGRRGEAVINLFCDAHWAMDDNLSDTNGDFPHYKYNVTRSYSEGYDIVYVKTITHRVYFKSDANLNNFTFEMLDPFLLSFYVGGKEEIHVDEFSGAQTMYEYNTISFKDLPWALKIPVRNFKYPLEGVEIGFRKKGYMFGAYMTVGHGFGEWCEDHRNYQDWYLYPEDNQVY